MDAAPYPVPPAGVTLDPSSPPTPAASRGNARQVCVWLTNYVPGDGDFVPISAASASPRSGVPLYLDESVTLDELTFAARSIDAFKHTNSIHVRSATDRPGSFTYFLVLDAHRTVGRLAARHGLQSCEGVSAIVVACRNSRTHQAPRTKKLAQEVGLDYDKQYTFAVDAGGCHFMGAHHYLLLQCPELEARSRGTWLCVEHQKTYARGLPRQINSYKIRRVRRPAKPPSSERPSAATRVTTSLKNLDATLAHVVEQYPKYSLKNINCQFFVAKSVQLLGVQEALRPQWFDHLQRVIGRSEAAIRRRHEAARADPPRPRPQLRCRVKSVGARVRRWFSNKLSRSSFDAGVAAPP